MLVCALSIAAHLFNPHTWPPLGIDILHTLHGPGFALLGLLILWYLQHQCHSVINYFLAAAIAMAIGLISEAAQIPGGRDAQVMDLAVDALGIVGVIGLAASRDRFVRTRAPQWLRLALPAAAGAALATVCLPTLWLSYALMQQKSAFPVFLTFEHRWENAAFGQTENTRPTLVSAPVDWPGNGSIVARAKEQGRWGIFLSLHPLPDWRGYVSFNFLAASLGEEFSTDICIRDRNTYEAANNLFCKRVRIRPSPLEYSIAFTEFGSGIKMQTFDASRVRAVVFSAATPGGAQEILIDDVRLE